MGERLSASTIVSRETARTGTQNSQAPGLWRSLATATIPMTAPSWLTALFDIPGMAP
jgi:hypothetical protein